MPVVVMRPAIEHGGALPRVVVRDAICPFAQGRLNEPLGLTVGLGPVGTCEVVAQAELVASRSEAPGMKGGAVVGQQPAYRDAESGEVFDRGAQERLGTARAFIGLHLREPDPGVVIDRHEQKLPSGTINRVPAIARHPMAQTLDTTE